jgi:hypothetical protein
MYEKYMQDKNVLAVTHSVNAVLINHFFNPKTNDREKEV